MSLPLAGVGGCTELSASPPSQESLRRLPWCTCVSASARQSRAQCCAREFICKFFITEEFCLNSLCCARVGFLEFLMLLLRGRTKLSQHDGRRCYSRSRHPQLPSDPPSLALACPTRSSSYSVTSHQRCKTWSLRRQRLCALCSPGSRRPSLQVTS